MVLLLNSRMLLPIPIVKCETLVRGEGSAANVLHFEYLGISSLTSWVPSRTKPRSVIESARLEPH